MIAEGVHPDDREESGEPTPLMAAAALVCGLVIAAPRDWRYSSPPPTDFQAAAAQFDRAPPGTTMVLPIEPAPGWKMTLHKH